MYDQRGRYRELHKHCQTLPQSVATVALTKVRLYDITRRKILKRKGNHSEIVEDAGSQLQSLDMSGIDPTSTEEITELSLFWMCIYPNNEKTNYGKK